MHTQILVLVEVFTCLPSKRATDLRANPTQASTVGAAFLTKTIPELNVKFEIWDTAGQERYHTLAPMYYRWAP